MKIAIIGAGNIGSTLGRAWAQAGYHVAFGVRVPADPKYASLAEVGTVTELSSALAEAEVVLLSLPGAALAEFIQQYAPTLAGKLVIDATNNPRSPVLNNLDMLHAALPESQLVRAFSTLGWENFANPVINGIPIDLFYCGSAAARPLAEQLISAVGLRPVYIGGIDAAAALDGMTRVWFALVFGQGRGRRLAFKLIEE